MVLDVLAECDTSHCGEHELGTGHVCGSSGVGYWVLSSQREEGLRRTCCECQGDVKELD